ncbi:hypothetical protein M0805_007614 [Coniferiporia weirii]|nr:hypothetical protein M0805_007614 [Coniferiporia weirii]
MPRGPADALPQGTSAGGEFFSPRPQPFSSSHYDNSLDASPRASFDPYSDSFSPSQSPAPGPYARTAPLPPLPSTGSGFRPVPTSENLVTEHEDNPLYMPSAQFGANTAQRGYSNMEGGGNSAWLEKQERGSSRSKWIAVGSVVAIAAIIAIAVGVGVSVSKKNSSSSSLASSGGSGSSSGSSSDPSDFVKDPALKQSFYGIAYTPEGSQLPECGNSLDQVITDIQLLSQLTTRLRIYGADCNQSSLVLEAIKQTKVNMTVWLGNYNIATDAGAAYVRQRDEIQTALQAYGTANIGGITVGNEFMLDFLDDNNATDPNSDIGNVGAQLLIANITDTRQMLSQMNIDLPVGTSDAGAYFNNEVLAAVDYGMANVHPWFADTTIDDAAAWTWDFFTQTDVAAAQAVSNKPNMYIAETGWPSNSSSVAAETNGASAASEANLQIFLDNFVCQANANGTEYFFFEYFDEEWKDIQFGGVEGWWGLFYQNRTLKGITIPDCST